MLRTLGKSQEEYHFIKCSCHAEAVEVSQFLDKDDNEISMCFWEMGKGETGGYSWGHKLRLIWKVIAKGHPYNDSIILGEGEARQLAEILVRFADRMKNNSKETNSG